MEKTRNLRNISKNICIFKTCPVGSDKKDSLLFGQIKIKNHNLCTFEKCPKSAKTIGIIGTGKNTKHLCGFDTCPKGSLKLGDYL